MDDLRRLSIWAPLLFLVGLELVRRFLLAPRLGMEQASLVFMAAALIGVVLFSLWMFGLIERAREGERRALQEARDRYEEVEALRQATAALTSELELDPVLQKVVDLSRRVVGARYGALGVLDDRGERIVRFITSGLDEATAAALGDSPTGRGILGLVIAERAPVRLDDLTGHPASVGFPPGHPPMHSFLGLPIIYQEQVLGNLYLTEKEHGSFTARDEEIIEQFAAQAAVAITHARLFAQTEQLAVLEERERIGMDLHDGTIQSLYALGLMLEGAAQRVEEEPQAVARELDRAVETLGRIIGDVRHYIFDLRVMIQDDVPLREQLEQLLAALRLEERVEVRWRWELPPGTRLEDRQLRAALLHIMREALTNALKHAQASTVTMAAAREDGEIQLSVADDGVGFAAEHQLAEHLGGRGLTNMEARARAVGSRLWVRSAPGQGTEVVIGIPAAEGETTP